MITIHEQCQIVANRLAAGAVDRDTAVEQVRVIVGADDPFEIILDFVTMFLQQANRASKAEQSLANLQDQRLDVLVDNRDLQGSLKVAKRQLLQIARIAAAGSE